MKLDPLLWSVYLSGEIHTDWRSAIADGIKRAGLPVRWTAPVTDHAASDDCGVNILGIELDHALKEIDAAACATSRDPDQVVKILHYVIEQL